MFESKYIKATDLQGKKVNVTVQSVTVVTLGNDEQQEKKPCLIFKGKDKGMICNKTNWNTLIELYGPDTDEWTGKSITIYPAEVAFKGKMTLAIRISLHKPTMENVTTKPQERKADAENEDSIPF